MAKGIRVNQLAIKLGISSRAILDKCKEKGLGDKVPQHWSPVSPSLVECIKEWFFGQGGKTATAEEIAPKRPDAIKKADQIAFEPELKRPPSVKFFKPSPAAIRGPQIVGLGHAERSALTPLTIPDRKPYREAIFAQAMDHSLKRAKELFDDKYFGNSVAEIFKQVESRLKARFDKLHVARERNFNVQLINAIIKDDTLRLKAHFLRNLANVAKHEDSTNIFKYDAIWGFGVFADIVAATP